DSLRRPSMKASARCMSKSTISLISAPAMNARSPSPRTTSTRISSRSAMCASASDSARMTGVPRMFSLPAFWMHSVPMPLLSTDRSAYSAHACVLMMTSKLFKTNILDHVLPSCVGFFNDRLEFLGRSMVGNGALPFNQLDHFGVGQDFAHCLVKGFERL